MDRGLRILFRVVALGALAFSSALMADYVFPTATYCGSGGGCNVVRAWAGAVIEPYWLPLLGVIGFTVLFTGSFFEDAKTTKLNAVLAVLGALIAIVLVAIQGMLGVLCWLCAVVDSLAIVAGVIAVVLASGAKTEAPRAQLLNPWWALWIIAAFAPIAWAGTILDTAAVPAPVRARYRAGAINVLEMADFECPFCRAMHPVLRTVLADVEGDVNVMRVIVPLRFHRHARDAARAYHCGALQGRAEVMADRLFAAEDLSPSGTIAIARELDLDISEFEQCLRDPAIERQIRADEEFAQDAGMRGLPTVFIQGHTFIGFDESNAEARYREAIEHPRNPARRYVEWRWLSLVFGAALIVAIAGAFAALRRRAAESAPKNREAI